MGNPNPLQKQLKKHYTFCLEDQSQAHRDPRHSETAIKTILQQPYYIIFEWTVLLIKLNSS